MNMQPLYLLTCSCGPYEIGFDLRNIQEVVSEQYITPVPRATPGISGLINLRGNVVSALSLAEILRVPAEPSTSENHRHVILTLASSIVSLVVDTVGDVIEVAQTEYFSNMAGLPHPVKDIALGIYRKSGKAVVHLDPERTCNLSSEVRL